MTQTHIKDRGLTAQQHHQHAAEHHDQASKHHREAVKHQETGNVKEAERHSHAAFGFANQATEHGAEAHKTYVHAQKS